MVDNNKKRARIYARFSSSNQRDESIDGQIRTCRDYAAREGFEITGEYADRALSGKGTEKRASFLKMVRDAERGRFDVLLVYKMDRFARNRYDAAMFKSRLKRAGVQVVSVMEAIPDGAEGIILESVLDGFAEYYSANLAENIKRGRMETALAGKFNGGQTPFGYKIENGHYVVDEARAPVVREIFEMCLAGYSPKEIYTILNARGLRNLKGKPFSRGSITSILTQEKYKGDFIFNIGSENSITVPDAIPAIIPPALWDAVQAKREKRAKRQKHDDVSYSLSNAIFCGECGVPFHGCTCKKDGNFYYYYRHFRGDKKCTCANRSMLRKDALENALFSTIAENVLTPDFINAIVKQVMDLQEEEKNDSVGVLKAELSSVDSSLANIYKAIESGLFSSGMQSRVKDLESRREILLAEIEKDTRFEDERLTAGQIESFLNSFLGGNINDSAFRERLISELISRVVIIDKHRAEVYVKYAADSESFCFEFNTHALAHVHNSKYNDGANGTFCLRFSL